MEEHLLPQRAKSKDNKEDSDIYHELKSVFEADDTEEQKRAHIRDLVSGISISRQFYSAPLPPPDDLRAYNDAVPNGAERILTMAENQSAHRIEIESKAISAQIEDSKRGQIFGLIVAIVFAVASVWLALQGHDTVASILGGSTIVGLVTVFVVGKKEQREDLSQKDLN